MYYGHDKHEPSPDDLTVLQCYRCGWVSEELNQGQVRDLGVPLYCHGACGKSGVAFIRFHPNEREQAKRSFGRWPAS